MSAELKIVNEENEEKEEVTKEERAISYLKSMMAIEKAMEPYKEQKKDLRKNYMENGWLTRQDIWNAVKAFRLYEQDADMDDLNDMFETVEQQFGEKSNA
jgi:predicted RNase H-like nuclease (RuvC/YqgF family)